MAKEILAFPEQHLAEVVTIIRTGLFHGRKSLSVSPKVYQMLSNWCDGKEAYLKDMAGEDDASTE